MDGIALVSQVGWGHALLFVCAVFYLAWWTVFFRDVDDRPTGALRILGIACIVVAAIAGIAAVAVTVVALVQMPMAIPPFLILAVAVVLYLVLMVGTRWLAKRSVTTELALIVGWMALEVSTVNGIASLHAITGASFIMLALVLAVAFIVNVVCYTLYYALKGRAAFIDGCIPLVIVGIISALLAIALV